MKISLNKYKYRELSKKSIQQYNKALKLYKTASKIFKMKSQIDDLIAIELLDFFNKFQKKLRRTNLSSLKKI